MILKTFFTLALFINFAFAQFTVAPVSILLDENEKTGFFIVRNTSDLEKEFFVEPGFGYPVSDDSGKVFVKMFDTIEVDQPSAVRWIRFYPRCFKLLPGETQTVRFLLRPPSNIENREYWVRPSITSKSVNNIEKNKYMSAVSIILEMKIFISINYRKGNVKTGIRILDESCFVTSKKLVYITDLERTGNAAYLGKYEVKIFKSNGEVILKDENDIAVYYKIRKRYEFGIEDFNKGEYTGEIILSTGRMETTENVLYSEPIKKTFRFIVP